MTTLFLRISIALVAFALPVVANAIAPVWDRYVTNDGLAASSGDDGSWLINEDRIYTAIDFSLSQIDTSTGKIRWAREIGANPSISLLPGRGVAVAYDGDDETTTIIERIAEDGATLWKRSIARGIGSIRLARTPLPSRAIALRISALSQIALFDDNGNERWRREDHHWTGDCFLGTTGLVACTSGGLSMYSALDGTPVTGPADASEVGINDDGSLTAFGTNIGGRAYRFSDTAALVQTTPAPSPYALWMPAADGGLAAYIARYGSDERTVIRYAASGQVLWSQTFTFAGSILRLTVQPDHVYFNGSGGIIRVGSDGVFKPISSSPGLGEEPQFRSEGYYSGYRTPAARYAYDGSKTWAAAGSTLADNVAMTTCRSDIRVDGPYVVGTRSSAPSELLVPATIDRVARANADVSRIALPEVNVPTNSEAPQYTVPYDGDDHVYAVRVDLAGDGMTRQWRLREYTAAGDLVRESPQQSLPYGNSFDLRDVLLVADAGRIAIVGTGSRAVKFDRDMNVLWSTALPRIYQCGDVRFLPYRGGLLALYRSGEAPGLMRIDADGTVSWQQNLSQTKLFTVDGQDNIFVVSSSYPGGDVIRKLASDGTMLWQTTAAPGAGAFPSHTYSQIAIRGDGVVAAVGTHAATAISPAMLVVFNADGSERWAAPLPYVTGTGERATGSAVAFDAAGAIVAAVHQPWSKTDRSTLDGRVHRSWQTAAVMFSESGQLLAAKYDLDRHAQRTSAGWTALVAEANGDIIQAGRFAPPDRHFMAFNVRRIALAPTPLRLSISYGAASYQLGERLAITAELRDTAGNIASAAGAVPVWIVVAPNYPIAAPTPRLLCTIAAGASSCSSNALHADRLGTFEHEFFLDDGFHLRAPAITITRADVALSAAVVPTPPYRAGESIDIDYLLQPVRMLPGDVLRVIDGYFLPRLTANSNAVTCVQSSPENTFPVRFRCKVPLIATTTSVTVNVAASDTTNASNTVVTSLAPVARSTPVITLEALWPRIAAPLGQSVTPVISLRVAGELTRGQVGQNALILTLGGQSCEAKPVYVDPYTTNETGNYSCALALDTVGVLQLSAQYAGSAQLTATTAPALGSVNVRDGPGFIVSHPRSQYLNGPYTLCSPRAGMTCERSPNENQSMCTVTSTWSGPIYVQPPKGYRFRFTGPQQSLGPLLGYAGVVTPPLPTSWLTDTQCSLDFDGDGYVNWRDALLLLRATLGFSGAALTSGVLSNCATATTADEIAADVARQSNSMFADLDVDRSMNVRGGTDGLLVLRYILGLRGEALMQGIVLPYDAQNRTAEQITAHLDYNCK